MRKIIIFTFLAVPSIGFTQNSDTLYLPPNELSDTILGGLTPTNFPTGFLHDRLLQDDTIPGYLSDYQLHPAMAKSSDLLYGTLMELDRMSVTPNLFSVQDIYEGISAEVGKHHFDTERTVIPLGVIDYDYHDLDFNQGMSSQLLYFNGVVLTDMGAASSQLYTQKNVQMIAPMYDRVDLDDLWFIFKPEWTYVDSQGKQVASVEILEGNNQWTNVPFDIPFEVSLNDTATIQTFTVKITYVNQQVFTHSITIQTPYLPLRSSEDGSAAICDDNKWESNIVEDTEKNKLGWCLIQSCKTQKLDTTGIMFHSPLLIVTGYRPPIFKQKFKKTWKLYNDDHDDLLNTMRRHQFDVFLIRFNIHAKPKKHGMQESAELFITFLKWVNANKADPYAENVIQASSMGSDIVRLALMKMDHKHMNDGGEHHHTRLFNSYDPNFNGGNVPLAYQYMIKSSAVYPPVATLAPLSLFLNAFVRQKTVKELLTYHAFSGGLTPLHFASPILDVNVTPSHHQLRQDYLDALELYDSHEYIVPLPTSTRNISISLGKIRGTNDELEDPKFNASEDPWRNIWLPSQRFYLSPAKYSETGYEKLYRNRGIRLAFYVIPFGITHGIDVNQMQEVDNAAGSYIKGIGNIIELADNAYWFYLLNGFKKFSHKSVITSFAINESLWPADGTHTIDMHDLDIMYDSEDGLVAGVQSNHYGYPNLGRPTDHFNVTPFEAIYVDNRPNNHINLSDDDPTDRAILTNFLLKEYRPWVLGLQNDHLGSQAVPSYAYKSRRMAKRAIHTGFNVTPTTDKGDYVVNANADLILEAGKYIELRPGTYTELGAVALIHIYYEDCNDLDSKSLNQDNSSSESSDGSRFIESKEVSDDAEVKLYPNPSHDGTFKIKSLSHDPIRSIDIYDFQGNIIWDEENVGMTTFVFERRLEKGIYLVRVKVKNDVTVVKRLVIL